ncbi:hypothetical protein Leryth_006560 [Lithospermum erythrorhizon]|nr:hypothetical protein Leryth_006560 [Lithospermum erythrorhizon]
MLIINLVQITMNMVHICTHTYKLKFINSPLLSNGLVLYSIVLI